MEKRIDPRADIVKRLLSQADKKPAWLSRQLGHSDPQKVYDWLKGVAVQRIVKTRTGRTTEDFDHGLRYRFEK